VFGRIVRTNPNAHAGGFSFGRCFEKITVGHGEDSSRRFLRDRSGPHP
jgi:hypothetical protein